MGQQHQELSSPYLVQAFQKANKIVVDSSHQVHLEFQLIASDCISLSQVQTI
jgi:hypothetical protein